MKKTKILGAVAATLAMGVMGIVGMMQEVGATSGEMILSEDTVLTEKITVESGEVLTIDLNGHTLTTYTDASEGRGIENNGGTLTIKDSVGTGLLTNGEETAGTSLGLVNNLSGSVTISGVKMIDYGGGNTTASLRNLGVMTVENSTFEAVVATCTGNYGLLNYGDDGVLTASNSSFSVKAGSISCGPYAVIIRGGTATLNNLNVSGAKGGVGIDYGEVTINGGSYEGGAYYGMWITNDDDMTKATLNGGTYTGGMYGLYATVDDGKQDMGDVGIVINDGKFYGGKKGAVAVVDDPSENEWGMAIYGGEFSTDPSEYLTEGYEIYNTGDETYPYGVRPKFEGFALDREEVTVGIGETGYVGVSEAPEWYKGKVDYACQGEVAEIAGCYYNADEGVIEVTGETAGSVTVDVVATLDGEELGTKSFNLTVEQELVNDWDYDNETGTYVGVSFETPVEGGNRIVIASEEISSDLAGKEADLKALFDISVMDKDGKIVAVNGNKITITLSVPRSLVGDNQYFQIVYVNDEGEIAEYIDVDDMAVDGDFVTLTFTTTHLSSYGVLAANTEFAPAAERNAALINTDTTDTTGSETSSPDTGRVTRTAEGAAASGVIGAVVATAGVTLGYVAMRASWRRRRERTIRKK